MRRRSQPIVEDDFLCNFIPKDFGAVGYFFSSVLGSIEICVPTFGVLKDLTCETVQTTRSGDAP